MEKNRVVRLYLWISFLMIGFLVVINIMFLNDLPTGFYGTIEKTLFNISFISSSATLEVFNLPLVYNFVFLGLTIVVLVYALLGESLNKKLVVELLFYNLVIAIVMVVGSILFIYLMPEVVNGILVNKIYMTTVPAQANNIHNVYNLGFILLALYLIINTAILIKTKEQRVVSKKEYEEEELLL